jgi:hypothetical protein
MVERRNNWTRSLAYLRIVDWLKKSPRGDDHLPPTIDAVIATRILKRLAARGLATEEAGKWRPTLALLHPTNAKKVES